MGHFIVRFILPIAICAACFAHVANANGNNQVGDERSAMVVGDYQPGDFRLADQSVAADVYVDVEDFEVARVAAQLLTEDIERVTGLKPILVNSVDQISEYAVLIGTIGKSPVIDRLIESGKIDVNAVRGQWETFSLQVVENPLPGVEQGLVIVGSDRRGTAYGVFELSEQIGVSPWYWWADVPTQHRDQLIIRKGDYRQGPPSVKYRGIFINDEMWGLRPWASETFAPEEGFGIGPKTHAKIFELLLRLKANYLWPAMHQQTKSFNFYPLNKVVADRYAIVMGSSHIEPMLRNNIGGAEWDVVGCGPWNYAVNRDSIYQYWKDRIETNGRYENIYTIGIRGQDDTEMEGGETPEEKMAILEQAFDDQRTILNEVIGREPKEIPQVFIPYTEVLGLYDRGLNLPEDPIICWPDDNFGYIRRLPLPAEKERSGGSGIYYHIQWLNGATTAYMWLNTMPPALICEEMRKAYDFQSRELWVLNVGDIKPGEIGTELFLNMAWDIDGFDRRNSREFLVQWAARDFGTEYAEEIADIMQEYYQLGFSRRPEQLVMYNHRDGLTFSNFSHDRHNDEAQIRLDRYSEIARRAEALYAIIPEQNRDAFFEMVLYSVKCSSLMNHKVIYADRNRLYAEQGRASAADYAERARAAERKIIAMTEHYNTNLETVGDKWDHIIMAAPGPWGAQMRQFDMPPLIDFNGNGPAELGIALEGADDHSLPDLSVYTKGRRFVDLFNQGAGSIQWQASTDASWITLSKSNGTFEKEERIWISIDWAKAPKGLAQTADVVFASNATAYPVTVTIFNPESPRSEDIRGFVESHGYIAMEAENFSRKIDRNAAGWETHHDLGRSGDSMTVLPVTITSRTQPDEILAHSPSLEYDAYVFHPGRLKVIIDCLPTNAINREHGLRLAISVDNQLPQIVNAGARNVITNLMEFQTEIEVESQGPCTLKIWMVDPGVVIDRLVAYTNGRQNETYFGPPESLPFSLERPAVPGP